jgi:hypothetical protein
MVGAKGILYRRSDTRYDEIVIFFTDGSAVNIPVIANIHAEKDVQMFQMIDDVIKEKLND